MIDMRKYDVFKNKNILMEVVQRVKKNDDGKTS